MKICLDFDEKQIKILNKICLDNNYPRFIQSFLQKNLFDELKETIVVSATLSHIAYYQETARLIKLVGLTQVEIANQLGFSQQALGKAFKLQNDNSVIYRAMQQHGSPDNFVFDIYTITLINDDYTSLNATVYSGDVYDFLNSFLAYDFQKKEACFKFIMMLSSFAKRIKPKQYKPEFFFNAVKKLNKQLFENFDIFLVSNMKDIKGNELFCTRSAEQLYTALKEYYLSLEL